VLLSAFAVVTFAISADAGAFNRGNPLPPIPKGKATGCSVKGLKPRLDELAEYHYNCAGARMLPDKVWQIDKHLGFGLRKFRRLGQFRCEIDAGKTLGACVSSDKKHAVSWFYPSFPSRG